jgi:hypothetical protein
MPTDSWRQGRTSWYCGPKIPCTVVGRHYSK